MASTSDPSAAPGEADNQPDTSNATDLANGAAFALDQGHDWQDIQAAVDNAQPDAEVTRPSLSDVWSGGPPGGDNDPTRLDTDARPQIDQVVQSGFGIGAVEGIGARALSMGVAPTTAELGATVAAPAAREAESAFDTLQRIGGNKWVRRIGAATAGYNTFYPLQGSR